MHDVAPATVAPHDVLAAVDARVRDARPGPFQDPAPGAFTAPDVEHGTDFPAKNELRCGESEARLAQRRRGRDDAPARSVPPLVVRLVVFLVWFNCV